MHAEVVGDAVLAMVTEPDGTAKSRRDEQTELAALTAVGLAHHPVLMEQLWANGALRHLAGWWERGAAQSAPGTDVYARALRVAEAGGQEVTGTAMPSEAARLRDVAKSRAEGGPSDERGLARLFVGEDRTVWQSQMAEAAAHGGLDFADLQQAPSLPTLAKLATIPALCRKACRAICTVAAVTAPVGHVPGVSQSIVKGYTAPTTGVAQRNKARKAKAKAKVQANPNLGKASAPVPDPKGKGKGKKGSKWEGLKGGQTPVPPDQMTWFNGLSTWHGRCTLWNSTVGCGRGDSCAFKHESFVDGDKTKPAALHHALGTQVSA